MRTLTDGGLIYTLGGQGDGSVRSTFTGNVLSIATASHSRAHGIYLDEGSSWWDVHDNIVAQTADNWAQVWTGSIHDITIHDNYSDVTKDLNNGTNVSITDTTYVTNGEWPAAARTIAATAGLEPAYQHLAAPEPDLGNDGSLGDLLAPVKITYNGDWAVSSLRFTDEATPTGTRDLNQDVHYTRNNGGPQPSPPAHGPFSTAARTDPHAGP